MMGGMWGRWCHHSIETDNYDVRSMPKCLQYYYYCVGWSATQNPNQIQINKLINIVIRCIRDSDDCCVSNVTNRKIDGMKDTYHD